MRITRMRQLADLSLEELRRVLIKDLRKIPTARVKRRLQRYLHCRYLIDSNVEHLQQLRSQAQRITAAYKAVPGSGGNNSGKSDIITEIVRLQAIVEAESTRLEEELRLVQFIINSLDNFQERIVLQYRYVNGKTFEAIAEQMSYDIRQITRIHGRALRKLVPLEEKMS